MADASKGGGAGGPGDQPPARPWSAAEAAAAKLAGKKRIAPSSIKNKMKRTEVLRRQKAAVSKTKVEAKRARKREVSEVGDQAAPKQVSCCCRQALRSQREKGLWPARTV